jgi:uncharacterized phage-like protein YoqJ
MIDTVKRFDGDPNIKLKTMCATGHRPLQNDWDIAHPTRQMIRNHLYPELKKAHLFGGFNDFYTGMSQGFDQDFAMCVIQLRVEMEGGIFLHAAVPFEDQETMWPLSARQVYREILDQCDEIVHVCEPGYAPWKMQKRNEFMVDISDHVMALWNGKQGGTKNCIRYALSKDKRVTNLLAIDVRKALQ